MKSRLLLVSALVFTAMAARSAEAVCPKLECGTNSPLLDTFDFHELSQYDYNKEGLRLVGLWVGFQRHDVRVERDRLKAIDGAGNVVAEGDDLIGTYLEVETADNPPTHYFIFIKEVSRDVKFWVDPGQDQVETYGLLWIGGNNNTDPRPLCPNPPIPKEGAIEDDEYVKPYQAVVFTGDRYHAQDKLVTSIDPHETDGWFNIACAGNALYKLHMTRHTTASSNFTHHSSLDERQAMLKMYVSDVCGNGDSYTLQGTRLHWNNVLGWGFLEPTDTIEAFWGPKGAMCFKEHRLGDQFKNQILACLPHEIESCDDAFPDWKNHWPSDAFVVSMIPK